MFQIRKLFYIAHLMINVYSRYRPQQNITKIVNHVLNEINENKMTWSIQQPEAGQK